MPVLEDEQQAPPAGFEKVPPPAGFEPVSAQPPSGFTQVPPPAGFAPVKAPSSDKGQLPDGTLAPAPKRGYLDRVGENIRNSAVGQALGLEPTLHEGPELTSARHSLPNVAPEWAQKPIVSGPDQPGAEAVAPDAAQEQAANQRLQRATQPARTFLAEHPKTAAVADVGAGVGKGAGDFGKGLSSPESIALMMAAPESKILSAYFAAQAGQGAYESAEAAHDAFVQGNNSDAARYATQAGLNALVAAVAGRHALNGAFPVDTARPRVTPPAVEYMPEPPLLGAGRRPDVEQPTEPPLLPGGQGGAPRGLPAKTEGVSPSIAPPPPVDQANARTRVVPTKFTEQPTPTPDKGVIVDPEGRALRGSALALPPPPKGFKPVKASPVPAEPTAPPDRLSSQAVSTRPIVQASDNPAEVQQSAASQQHVMDKVATTAVQGVPDAEVEGMRVKDADSIANKEERGKPVETTSDVLGARVSAPADQLPQVEKKIEATAPVVAKEKIDNNGIEATQYEIRTGTPGEPNQVSELQVATPEMANAMKQTDDLYAKQKEAIARGDRQEAAILGAKISEIVESAKPVEQKPLPSVLKPGTRVTAPSGKTGDVMFFDQRLKRARVKYDDGTMDWSVKASELRPAEPRSQRPSNRGEKREVEKPAQNIPETIPADKGGQNLTTPENSSTLQNSTPTQGIEKTPEHPEAKGDKWIGVDLDGTLARYDGFKGKEDVGAPIPAMVQRVKDWLEAGNNVKILTARVSDDPGGISRNAIEKWTEEHLGQKLPVTDTKDHHMVQLYDDRAVSVERNTGKLLAQPQEEPDHAQSTNASQPAPPAGFEPVERPERRTNTAERKRVSEMSPDEMQKELLTSPKTGLPNRRAFDEAEKEKPAAWVGMSDADGLKALNDKFGYEAGDSLLAAKAEALRQAGVEAYHDKGDEFLYRSHSEDELKRRIELARAILSQTPIHATVDGQPRTFKGADFSYGTGHELSDAETRLKAHKSEREARGERARGELRGITETRPEQSKERPGGETEPAKASVVQGKAEGGGGKKESVTEPKYKFGNTQHNIPEDSPAGKALDEVRARVRAEDLDGDGKEIDGNHVTVRYGIKGDDTAGIRAFLEKQAPFEAKLGPIASFPPSEHSDGAAPLVAAVESPELHRLNAEIEKHGEFTEPSFKEYKPHATIAYVKPAAVSKYVGDKSTEGKTFTVDSVSISDRNGDKQEVQLKGRKKPSFYKPKPEPKPAVTETTKPEPESTSPDVVMSDSLAKTSDGPRLLEKKFVRNKLADYQERGIPAFYDGTNLVTPTAKYDVRYDENGKLSTFRQHDLTKEGFEKNLENYGPTGDRSTQFISYNRAAKEAFDKMKAEKDAARERELGEQRKRQETLQAEQSRAAALQTRFTRKLRDRLREATFTKATYSPKDAKGTRLPEKKGEALGGLIAIKGDGGYDIGHLRSGALVAQGLSNLENAKITILRFMDLTDWTQDADAIKASGVFPKAGALSRTVRSDGATAMTDEDKAAIENEPAPEEKPKPSFYKKTESTNLSTQATVAAGTKPPSVVEEMTKRLEQLEQEIENKASRLRELNGRGKTISASEKKERDSLSGQVSPFGGKLRAQAKRWRTEIEQNSEEVERLARRESLPLTEPEETVLTDPDQNKWKYQGEYFIKALTPVRDAWQAKHEVIPGAKGVKRSEYLKKPEARPDDFREDYIRIEVPGDGKFLIVNTPAAIDKILRGAPSAFAKPSSTIPGTNARAVPRAPKEVDPHKMLEHLESRLDEAKSDLAKAKEADKSQHQKEVDEVTKQIEDMKEELRKPKTSGIGSTLYSGGFLDPQLFRDLFPDAAKRMKEWVTENPTAGDLQKEMMRETRGQRDRRVAAVAHKLDSVRRSWTLRPRADSIKFWNAIENQDIASLDPKDQPLARVFESGFGPLIKEIQRLKPAALQQLIDGYFPHLWERPSSARSTMRSVLQGKRPFAGKASFLKQRTIPTMADGIAMGLKPISWNPVDLFLRKYAEMSQFLMAHETIEMMEDAGTAKKVMVGQKPPEGWTQLDDRIGTVYSINDDDQLFIRGHYYAPAGAARVFNNYVSRGLAGRYAAYDILKWINNNMNALQLGISGFHAATTAINAATSEVALGIQQLSEGKPIKAAGHILSGMTVAPSIIRTLVNGSRLLGEYLEPGSQKKLAAEAAAVAQAGGRARMELVKITAFEKTINAFRNGAIGEGLISLPGAILQTTVAPVMDYLVPRMKLGAFYDMAHDIFDEAAEKGWDEEETRRKLQRAWDSIDNRFGQMVYDNLFWHKGLQDTLMLATRSVGWNFGDIRELGGAAKDVLREAAGGIGGKPPEITPRMGFAFALPLISGLIGAVLTYLWQKRRPQTWKDYFYPQRPDGTRVSIPGYMKDVFAFYRHPIDTLVNKQSPLIEATSEAIQNRDFYGTEIRHKDDPYVRQLLQVATWFGKQNVPFSLSGTKKLVEKEGEDTSTIGSTIKGAAKHPTDLLLGQFGFQPAPAAVQNSAALNAAREYQRANYTPRTRTAEQASKHDAMRKVEDMYRSKNVHKDTIDSLKKQGILNEQDLLKARFDARTDPLYAASRSLKPEQMLRVYQAGTDAEKKTLRPLLEEKSRGLTGDSDAKALRDEIRQTLHPTPKFTGPIV